jgi:hypothetical protein
MLRIQVKFAALLMRCWVYMTTVTAMIIIFAVIFIAFGWIVTHFVPKANNPWIDGGVRLGLFCVVSLLYVVGIGMLHARYLGDFIDDVCYVINEWEMEHLSSIVICHHGSIFGIGRLLEFRQAEETLRKAIKSGEISASTRPPLYRLKNVATFSNKPEYAGKVTGTIADMIALKRNCVAEYHYDFLVPGTSNLDPNPTPMTLSDAYKMIFGREKK